MRTYGGSGASMFGLMVFTCVGRFRRKDESYDSCSWNTAYLKLALFLDVTYAIVLTLIDFAACHFAWFTCDGFCSFTSNHLFFWTTTRAHTQVIFFENSTIFIEKLVRWRHIADLRTSCEYTKITEFQSKKLTMKFRLRPKLI